MRATPRSYYSLTEIMDDDSSYYRKTHSIRWGASFGGGTLCLNSKLLYTDSPYKFGFQKFKGRIICPSGYSIFTTAANHVILPLDARFKERTGIITKASKDKYQDYDYDERRNKYMGYNNYDNNEDLYSLLKNTGFRGLKDRIFNRSLDVVTSHLKNHFGIEFSLDPTYVKRFTKWVSENDPKFKEHIANPYVLNNPLDSSDPELVGTFVIKMDKATYVRVNAHSDSRMNNNRTFITVFIFGKKTYKVYKQLCKYMFEANDDNNVLYTITAKEKGSWLCLGSTLICRPMDTLFFDTGIKEQIINHVNTWIEGQPLYQNRGLIYKTGILLYGKAGTGKSSLATAIATYLKCPLITIDTATFSNLNISEVVDAINADETRFVVLIDEIDTIFKSRDDEDMSETQKENTAKLLALLDSQQSPSNVVFVATTNYYDRLDKALTRKGRFDLMIKLDDMHRDAAINMCKSFELNDSQVSHVLDDMFKDCDTVNPANLQARILEELKP